MNIERLFSTHILHAMGTNSMVKQDNMVYVGLTFGLFTINLDNNEIQFYTKDK